MNTGHSDSADPHIEATFGPSASGNKTGPREPLSLRQAIAYLEDWPALDRESLDGEDRGRRIDEIDALAALAEVEQPLIWQAYQARLRRRRRQGRGTAEGLRVAVASREMGGWPV